MRRVCGATTRKGGRCKRAAFPLSNSCWQHSIARHPYIAATIVIVLLAVIVLLVRWMIRAIVRLFRRFNAPRQVPVQTLSGQNFEARS